MKYELKDYGFRPGAIEEDHFVLGGANSLPQIILRPDRQWDASAPEFEPQSRLDWDTYGCTVFGTLNAKDFLWKRLFSTESNDSERFVYNGTKTRPPGNDPHVVAEWIRNNGLIPEALLPMTDTFEEFITPDPLTANLIGKGREWLRQYNFGHEWVFKGDISRQEKINKMMDALQYSVLGVSVTAWIQDDSGIYVDDGQPNTHWCDVYGFTDKGWKVFDSYDQSRKIYSYDAEISFCKRYHLAKLETSTTQPNKSTWFIIEWLKRLFSRDYRLFGMARSSKWAGVRDKYLREHPSCAICGVSDKKRTVVHHKQPFHLHPNLELDPTNFVTLCESAGMNCHITFGHLGNFKSVNQSIDEDIKLWNTKVTNRPK